MKNLFIECAMGIAGDMFMAALYELVTDKDEFIKKMNGLGLAEINLSTKSSIKRGIMGTEISIKINNQEESSLDVNSDGLHVHNHEHEDHNTHKKINDIQNIISSLPISDKVKEHSLSVYNLIADAEAEVHGLPVNEIHFHEVGNFDAIIDIVGVCMLMEILAPDKIIVSPIATGYGQIMCEHGILPVPAPAVLKILQGVPIYTGNIKGELCTPTGAALVKHFADKFGSMPEMCLTKIGYGMGKKDFEAANCVRIFLGESYDIDYQYNEYVAELQCNIDDMTAESLAFACKTMFEAGAYDVFTTAVGMKKNRMGVLLTCLCDPKKADKFVSLIFQHTTTFGVRKILVERYTLTREVKTISNEYGEARVKVGKGYGVTKTKLEYEDIALLAKNHDSTIQEITQKFLKSIGKL